MEEASENRGLGTGRALFATAAAWLVFVAVDFLGHGVLLAHYWDTTSTYWRSDDELFRLIPLAYATFLVYCAFLVWLQLQVISSAPNMGRGAIVGVGLGAVFNTVAWLGVFTVLPMPWSSPVVWILWGTAESAAAGSAAGYVLGIGRAGARTAIVAGVAVGIIALGIMLQNAVGLA